MKNSNIEPWNVGDSEVAYYYSKTGGTSRGSLPLFIPKILPQFTKESGPQAPHVLSGSCFANDKKCKPAIGKQLALQCFLTMPIQSNRYFRNPYFLAFAKMYVEIHNKNVDTMYISTKLDNSVV